MKINFILIFAALMMLQACGSKSGMMYSDTSVKNTELAAVVINK